MTKFRFKDEPQVIMIDTVVYAPGRGDTRLLGVWAVELPNQPFDMYWLRSELPLTSSQLVIVKRSAHDAFPENSKQGMVGEVIWE